MRDQSQAEKGHIFKSPIYFAHKNILIGVFLGSAEIALRPRTLRKRFKKGLLAWANRTVLETSKIEQEEERKS